MQTSKFFSSAILVATLAGNAFAAEPTGSCAYIVANSSFGIDSVASTTTLTKNSLLIVDFDAMTISGSLQKIENYGTSNATGKIISRTLYMSKATSTDVPGGTKVTIFADEERTLEAGYWNVYSVNNGNTYLMQSVDSLGGGVAVCQK